VSHNLRKVTQSVTSCKNWPEDKRLNPWDLVVNALCVTLFYLVKAFSKRARLLPRADDPTKPLLMQVLLWHNKAKGVSVYLQHFTGPEAYEWFHRHRWQYMRSLILSGMYLEERSDWPSLIQRRRFNTYRMCKDTIHRVDYWAPLCWTIFYTQGPSDDWGYYLRGDYSQEAFVPWRQFIKARVPSLETGKLS
jgi:hypothetical protein